MQRPISRTRPLIQARLIGLGQRPTLCILLDVLYPRKMPLVNERGAYFVQRNGGDEAGLDLLGRGIRDRFSVQADHAVRPGHE